MTSKAKTNIGNLQKDQQTTNKKDQTKKEKKNTTRADVGVNPKLGISGATFWGSRTPRQTGDPGHAILSKRQREAGWPGLRTLKALLPIGVLFSCFGDGPGLPGGLIIHQGNPSISPKRTPMLLPTCPFKTAKQATDSKKSAPIQRLGQDHVFSWDSHGLDTPSLHDSRNKTRLLPYWSNEWKDSRAM